jgi:hypothetical protein
MAGVLRARLVIRAALLAATLALASCVPAPRAPEAARAGIAPAPPLATPRFAGAPTARIPVQPNGQLARDFLELSFRLETGRDLPVFTRFEGPITVGVEGAAPEALDRELDALLARLRGEAGIDIARAAPGERPSITVTALPRATLARAVPGAACFVVPRVSGWRDYLRRRFGPDVDWATLTVRRRAGIFLPADVSEQELRDCLHEELAQALGPLNDLYRLPHSVFNDDNVQLVLTAYDMTLLRATYDPALSSGMTRTEVAAALPAVLARANPAGARPGRTTEESPADWVAAMRAALAPDGPARDRVAQARRAVALARAARWDDARLPTAQLALGRAALATDPEAAIAAFLDAGTGFRTLYGEGIHAAHVAMQLGAFALAAGRAESALAITERAIPAARDAQSAGVLATLMLLRAEALAARGFAAEAARTRAEAAGWGRYAWGEAVLAGRMAEIASLAPRS